MFKYFKKHKYKMDYYKSLHSKKQIFKQKSPSIYKNTNPQMTTTQIQQPSSSILSTIKEGFAFGVGSSVAHNTVSRLFNSSSINTTDNKNTQDTLCISKTHCDIKLKDYEECVRQYRDNCKELISEYEKCIRA
jgi:hypothetical protein